MADAGVNEIQNMTSRIQSLAIQAASSNNAGELGKLDAERIKLESAIDKIANSTNFNGVNLLNGVDAGSAVLGATATGATVPASGVAAGGNTGNGTLGLAGPALVGTNGAAAVLTFTMNSATTGVLTSDVDLINTTTGATITAGTALTAANSGITATFSAGATANVSGDSFTANISAANGGTARTATAYTAAQAFQVGADNDTNNQVTVDLRNSYTTASLGLGTGDLTTQANAQTYIDTSKAAMDKLITQRADLGATQNQVAFVQANLSTSIEQTAASVSTIRDADMATEMADFTKNKILTQASTSMLAQANQAAQNVLSLFR